MTKDNQSKAKLTYIITIALFGTVAIFVKYITVPSSILCLVRGYLGALTIFIFSLFNKDKIKWKDIKANLIPLIVSGIIMGGNWVLLFEGYNFAPVSVCSLCYYMQAVFITILAPFVLKEKATVKKIICILIALFGMTFVCGVIGVGAEGTKPLGIILSTSAGLCYAFIVLINKKMKPIGAMDCTLSQLFVAATVMIPYSLLTVDKADINLSSSCIVLLLILSIFHTGVLYTAYFGVIRKIPSGTVAIFGYLDPIVSVILSALLLKEDFNMYTLIGTVLVIGSLVASELQFKKEK